MKSRLFLFLSISSLLILFVSGQLNAAAIYRYTGNNFNAFNGNEYDASMKITGILEFESDLPPNLTNASLTPISFNFKDGINAINNKNIDSQIMSFSTGPNGEITDWEIDVKTSYPEPTSAGDSWYRIRTTYTNDFGQTAHCIIVDALGHCATSAVQKGRNNAMPGDWELMGKADDLIIFSYSGNCNGNCSQANLNINEAVSASFAFDESILSGSSSQWVYGVDLLSLGVTFGNIAYDTADIIKTNALIIDDVSGLEPVLTGSAGAIAMLSNVDFVALFANNVNPKSSGVQLNSGGTWAMTRSRYDESVYGDLPNLGLNSELVILKGGINNISGSIGKTGNFADFDSFQIQVPTRFEVTSIEFTFNLLQQSLHQAIWSLTDPSQPDPNSSYGTELASEWDTIPNLNSPMPFFQNALPLSEGIYLVRNSGLSLTDGDLLGYDFSMALASMDSLIGHQIRSCFDNILDCPGDQHWNNDLAIVDNHVIEFSGEGVVSGENWTADFKGQDGGTLILSTVFNVGGFGAGSGVNRFFFEILDLIGGQRITGVTIDPSSTLPVVEPIVISGNSIDVTLDSYIVRDTPLNLVLNIIHTGIDQDGDGVSDTEDNCPAISNPLQSNIDGDVLGDLCDICPADNLNTCDTTGSAASEITEEGGGIVSTPDGQLSLELEPGDLAEDTTISVTQTTSNDPQADLSIGTGEVIAAYDFEPDGASFSSPVSLTILADVTTLNESQRSALDIYLQVAGTYEPQGANCTVVNGPPDIATCTLEILHFSTYAMLAPLDSDNDGVPNSFDGVVDACLNEDASGFDVDHDGCIDSFNSLTGLVSKLVSEGVISTTMENSLLSKVSNAEKSTVKESVCSAVNQLDALNNQVDAQTGNKISIEAATLVKEYADSVAHYLLSQLPNGGICS